MLMDNLAIIEEVAITIKDVYDTFSLNFYEDFRCHDELKNTKHVKIEAGNKHWLIIEKLIEDYVDALNDKETLKLRRLNHLRDNYDFRYRIKLRSTIQAKIRYNIGKDRYVAKTLNDLFGARIILTGIEQQHNELEERLNNLKSKGVITRYYTRHDGDYLATHCYFQTDNRYFPWELQIWDENREYKNRFEHARHDKEHGKLKGE